MEGEDEGKVKIETKLVLYIPRISSSTDEEDEEEDEETGHCSAESVGTMWTSTPSDEDERLRYTGHSVDDSGAY